MIDMKKTLSLLFALATSLTMAAQDNLALTATATASGYEGDLVPANAIVGNAGTRWGSNFEGNTDTEWFQLEWTEAQTFNTVKLLCENAMNAGNAPELAFDIQTSDNGTDWTTRSNVTGKNAGNGEYITVTFDAVTAKFVRFQGVKKGTWGYTFFEFEVYNADYSSQTLTSLVLPRPDKANAALTACKVGESIAITAFDQNAAEITSGITYTATGGTVSATGEFTPTAKGVCTVTAKLESVEKTVTIVAYEGVNLLAGKNAITNPEATDVALFNDGNWDNRGGLGSPADGHTWLYYDLMAYYTIDLVDLKQEQACGKNYAIQLSADGTVWTDAYTISDEAGMAGDVRHYFYGSDKNTNVRFVRFDCTEPATGYGVSIYEMAAYGVKTADIADTEAPTAFTATLKGVGFTTATLTLKATDNVSAITYIVSREGAADAEFNGASGEETTATINGLAPATDYVFTVVAKDAKGNATDALTVNATTAAWTAATSPTEDAANVFALFSDAYADTHNFSYQVWWDGQAKQEELEPVAGDKVWHISNFVFIGTEHERVDASQFEKLHMDVMPVGENLTLAVTPVNADENANLYVNTQELTANQWNAVDIAVNDFITAGLSMTKTFQIKLTGANGQNATGQEFYLDNIYYVKGEGNEPQPVVNPVPVPDEPTVAADKVLAVYSATYGKEELTTTDPAWGGYKDATGQPLYTSFNYVVLTADDESKHKVVHVVGAGINSRTKDDAPASGYNKLHAAIYPTTATTGVIFKDNGYDSRITISGLVPGQWNYIVKSVDFDNAYVTIALDGETEFYANHIFFENDGTATGIRSVQNQSTSEEAHSYYDLQGRRVAASQSSSMKEGPLYC